MKLSLSGIEMFFDNKPIETLIETADLFDIEYLDIWVPRNTKVSSKEEIKEAVVNKGKKVSCITTWSHICKEENIEGEIDLLNSSLEWAKYLNAPRVNTYFGFLKEKDDKKAIELFKRNIKPVLKEAEKNNITICIENEFDSRGHDPKGSDITRSADRLIALLKTINSPYFKATFDASNFYLAQEEHFPYAFEKLKGHIDYIHLKDARKFQYGEDENRKKWTDHGREYVFCSLVEGVVKWDRLIPACDSYNKDWICALEPHTSYTNDSKIASAETDELESKTIELMGKKVLEDYKTSIQYVRSLGVK